MRKASTSRININISALSFIFHAHFIELGAHDSMRHQFAAVPASQPTQPVPQSHFLKSPDTPAFFLFCTPKRCPVKSVFQRHDGNKIDNEQQMKTQRSRAGKESRWSLLTEFRTFDKCSRIFLCACERERKNAPQIKVVGGKRTRKVPRNKNKEKSLFGKL